MGRWSRSRTFFFQSDERLFASFDDLCVVCSPNVSPPSSKKSLRRWKSTRGSNSIWAKCKSGTGEVIVRQDAAFDRPLRSEWTRTPVWRGQGLPAEQGIRVLGIPILSRRICGSSVPGSVLCERILYVQDLQSAWLLLLFCANARAMYSLRGIPPSGTAQSAVAHDDATWSCFTTLLGLPFGIARQDLANIRVVSGSCGLRSATRSRTTAHWTSWADAFGWPIAGILRWRTP